MRLWTLLLLTAMTAPAGARGGAIDDVNALRAAGCGNRPPLNAALTHDARLDAAAARVAKGTDLQKAASKSGYHARRVARIRLENYAGEEVPRVLEEQFCGIVSDPELTDIGVHDGDRETMLVLAVPLELAAGTSPAGAADRLFAGINDARRSARRCGTLRKTDAAPPMRRSEDLDVAAAVHARDIAARGALGHEGADGSTAAERVSRTGYRWSTVGENVAAGQTEATEVVDTWLDSPGHCRNLMDPRFTETGLAVAVNEDDDRVVYWVQVYAAPQ